MNETSIDLALIGRLVRRRRTTLAVLAVLGAVLGAGLSFLFSPGYVSTSKVLLQGTRSANELPGETQIATSLIVLNHVADDLNWGVTGGDLQQRVSAVIADGNVLVVSGAAATPQAAQQLADKVTTEYVNFSTQIVTDAANASTANTQKARQVIQQKIDDANKRITEIQAGSAITAQTPDGDQARAALQQQQVIVADATKQMEQIDSAADTASLSASLSGANARIIELATLPATQASPTLVQLVLGGAVGLAVLGVLAHLIALRTDKRLRRAQDLAAAFGAPVLGLVGTTRAVAGRPSLLRRVLHDDRRWVATGISVVDDGRGRDARYQRVLQRLHADHGQITVVAIVPTDDPSALGALVDLAVAAAAGPVPVALVTEDEEWAGRVSGVAAEQALGSRLTAGRAVPDPGSAFTIFVAHVVAAQPTVPDVGPTDGALLLTELGTRTSWELTGIAGACADAGQQVLGIVAVAPADDNGASASAASAAALGAPDTTLAGRA
jgi:capsular polysaccharide biosynthesis protein